MKVLWGSFQDLGLDLRVSTPPASVFDLGFGSGVMAAMFLAVEEVEVVGVDLEDKVSVATATLRLKNWDVWRVSKNWSLLLGSCENRIPKGNSVFIFFQRFVFVCLGRGFSGFQPAFSFVGSDVQQSSFQLNGARGSGVWWSLCFLGFLQGLSVFCWKGREADLVLQKFGGIWETFYFFFGVRVKWHGEILFFFPKISPFYKAFGREVRTIYIHFRFWLETPPRNMLASDGPFRPFKQEQFQFLGGDAFMYLQKWPLGLSLRDGARVCCSGFVVEGSLSIKPKYQAHHTAFPAEILEMVEIFGDKFLPTVRNS